MSDVTIDIVENARWREEKGRVVEITRVAVVSGLSQELGYDGAFWFARIEPLIPKSGTQHPIETTCILEQRTFQALGPTMAQVELVYRRPDYEQQNWPGYDFSISGGTALEQSETQLDKNGVQITVTHQNITQGGSVTVLRPRDQITFRNRVYSSQPGVITRAYVGRTNSTAWNAGSPGTWLCESINFELEDAQSDPPGWDFTYVFRFNPNGWNPQVVFIDPETGKPPTGLVANVGYKSVSIYDTADFGSGGLGFGV